jgi:hypothetical protein
MCNAWNHNSGCGCGFGPPYAGTAGVVETIDWLDEIVDDRSSFNRALKDLRFDTKTLKDYLSEYDSIVKLPEPRESIKEKLRKLVDRRDYRIEDTRRFELEVPLFRLHSPAIKGAKVSYRESEAHNTDKGWLVKLFGVGMGRTKTVKVVYTSEFFSENGECSQIFVPLVLTVEKVAVYKSDVLKSRGIRAEIEEIKEEWTLRARGQKTLLNHECIDTPLEGKFAVDRFDVSGHRGKHSAKYKRSWAFDTARKVEIHLLNAFDFSFEPLATVKHEQLLELEFELPGKQDYRLRYNSSGLQWQVSPGRAFRGSRKRKTVRATTW